MNHDNHAHRKKPASKYYRPEPPFRIIEGIGTEPFKRLSPWAVWILAQFYARFNGEKENLYNLSLTYREVEAVMSNTLFIRAVWECVGFGFLDIRRFGRLERNASLYGLSRRWRGLTDPQKCDRVEALLEDIKNLQREKGVELKRAKLCALRNRLLAVAGQ